MSNSQTFGSKFIPYVPEIDPVLLEEKSSDDRSSEGSKFASDVGMTDSEMPVNTAEVTVSLGINKTNVSVVPLDFTKPTLIRRTAAPAPLELTHIRSNSNFTKHRDSEDSSPTTPGSASSSYSQLSFQLGSTTSTDPSPFATALPTPTDEHQKTATELAAETGSLRVKDLGDIDIIEHPWEQEAEFPTMMNLAGGITLTEGP
jgi:hypothetical protein